MTTISVIVGSACQGRFSEKPAKWIFQRTLAPALENMLSPNGRGQRLRAQ